MALEGFKFAERGGAATDQAIGASAERTTGAGVDRPIGVGTERTVGAGVERMSGAGMERPAGAAVDRPIGVGTERATGVGTERSIGTGMDRPLPKRRPNYLLLAVGALVVLGCVVAITQLAPRGLRVASGDIRVAAVQRGFFRNDILVRSAAAPLHTVILDALESGRVEEVLVNDGALVAKGELLFRLFNPQLRLDLVAREADRAQQISNVSNLRVTLETSQTEHQRRLLDLGYAVAQARRLQARNASLRDGGFISAATLEDSQDRLAQQQQALEDEKTRFAVEVRTKREGVRRMEEAIEQLDTGLQVVNESIEALAVRAPIAGRLTDFRLQVGEIVQPEQHIGRIDDPSQFKLVAEVDEYYLGLAAGKQGQVNFNGRDYPVEISRVFPQVREGRFSIELLFTHEAPGGLSPGQSAETRIELGEAGVGQATEAQSGLGLGSRESRVVQGEESPGYGRKSPLTPATPSDSRTRQSAGSRVAPGEIGSELLLPNDAFLNDTGGTWVFVVAPDGKTAERRAIRVGRHNDGQVEVAAGLAPGERVIVSAYGAFGKAEQLEITR
jgi:HlyD family secretion protein